MGEFVIKLLLYANDIVLVAKLAHGLQMHLYALEHFCKVVGMQVNTGKTKVMVFSNKKKQSQHTFFFQDNILEEVNEYKYLGIDFNKKFYWEDRKKKRI